MDENDKRLKELSDDAKVIEIYKDLLESRICYENGEYEDFDDALDDITSKYGLDDAERLDISEMIQKQLKRCVQKASLRELLKKLVLIDGSYPGFVAGIFRYASTSSGREERVMAYLKKNKNASCEEITRYVIEQPDFYDAGKQTKLERKLYEVTDTYPGFIKAVLNYASKKAERVENVLKYICDNKDVKSADILEFISNQADFYEDAVY